MEDAMIINKSSYERGFGHGSVYKTAVIDLEEEEKKSARSGIRPALKFCNTRQSSNMEVEDAVEDEGGMGEKFYEELDFDGLPLEGEVLTTGSPLCCFVDMLTGEHRIIKHKDVETAYVDSVRVLGTNVPTTTGSNSAIRKMPLRKISITLRYRRNPIIGDKFSSRHGQKGTLSVLWPQENMPFAESGVNPDVLINPHAFPSRMTIGMLIESMAGKAGAMHGTFQDSTPFQFHEERKVIDYVGEQLRFGLQLCFHFL